MLILCAFPLKTNSTPLKRVAVIPLNHVKGRIDHFAVDEEGQRIFFSALGNNTVEVIDTQSNRLVHEITGLQEPQGCAYSGVFNRLFVANRKTGLLNAFDGTSYQPVGNLDLKEDADNVRFDGMDNQVYVGFGEGNLGIVDPQSLQLTKSFFLPFHPESFQLEAKGPLVFVNIPGRGIAVVNRAKEKVVKYWQPENLEYNYPMALDEEENRLFVVFRRPARFVVFDTTTGHIVNQLDCAGDSDDVYYDSELRRIYVSGGDGFISVFQQKSPDHYKTISKIRTAPGARTSLFVPAFHRFYLAVPHRGKQKAELWVYETVP
jgi:DNA-binding beta-propeller fold protein YncE